MNRGIVPWARVNYHPPDEFWSWPYQNLVLPLSKFGFSYIEIWSSVYQNLSPAFRWPGPGPEIQKLRETPFHRIPGRFTDVSRKARYCVYRNILMSV